MISSSPARNPDRQGADPAYLITFVCYGSWLPGKPGAVDRNTNQFGSRWPEPNTSKEIRARDRMKRKPYRLDAKRRQIVSIALQRACFHRNWNLLASHVRATHVHAVIAAHHSPEHVMNALKGYASRDLNRMMVDEPDCRRWARHGSTRYLWSSDMISAAIKYVICEQGTPMAVFEMPNAQLSGIRGCSGKCP